MREQVMERHRKDSGMRSQAKTCSEGSSPRPATRSLKLCESHPLPAPTSRTRARDHSSCPSSSSTRRLVAGLDQEEDRKSTRLNSSHGYSSYAVFCLKKKKKWSHAQRPPLSRQIFPESS